MGKQHGSAQLGSEQLVSIRFLAGLAAALTLAGVLVASPALASDDWQRGVAAFKAGNYADAVPAFRAVAEAQPDWPGGHLMLGRSLLHLGKADEAAAALTTARQLVPDDVTTALALAQAELARERYAAVSEVLAGVDTAALAPDHELHLHRMRGIAALERERWSEAAVSLYAAIGLAPDDAELLYLHGTAAERSGKVGGARRSIARAAEIAPQSPKILRSHARLLRLASAKADDPAAVCGSAVAPARRLVQLAGDKASSSDLELLGDIETCAGEIDAAVATLIRAVAIGPDACRPHLLLGRAAARQEDWATAERELHRAATWKPPEGDPAVAWRELGFVYEKQKRFAEAREAYEKAGADDLMARVAASEKIVAENELRERLARLETRRAELLAELDASRNDLARSEELIAEVDRLDAERRQVVARLGGSTAIHSTH